MIKALTARRAISEIMHHIEDIVQRIARMDAYLLQTLPDFDLIGAAMLRLDTAVAGDPR